jgi:tetratricopeptide (TPR) repeat protein
MDPHMLTQQSSNVNAEIEKAVGLYQAGEFTRAANLCQRILTAQSNHSGALHLLGLIQHKAGDYAQAVDLIEQAVVLNPNSDSSWCNLGLAHIALGQHEQAVDCFQRALALSPGSATASLNLGMALSALGELKEAIPFYDRAIQLKPDLPQAHYNLGNALWFLGQFFEAEHSYRRALALKPDFPEACLNLGITLSDLEQFPAALVLFRRALQMQPDWPQAHFKLAQALQALAQHDEARLAFQRAAELNPEFAQAAPLARENVGDEPLDQTKAHLQQASIREQDLPEYFSNKGIALVAADQLDEAIALFDRAIALQPDSASLKYNKSLTLLLSGELAQGWPLYENRPARVNVSTSEHAPAIWKGQSLKGKRLLLIKEQGLGDQIQFLRYVPLLAAMGAEVDVFIDPALGRLAATVPGVARVIQAQPQAADYDYWSFLLSVPLHLGTTLDNIPCTIPYLSAPTESIAPWGKEIDDFAQGRRRVGLVWAGSNVHLNNRNRSIPLQALAPLGQVPGIALIVLQQDAIPEALAQVFRNTEVLLAGEQCKDFADTAAAIMNLDLVISVDTAVAHLAGALGRPVWTLLPCNRDWRWLLERDDSPWYPSMRLYRQQEYGQWDEVIARVAQDLSAKS